MGLISYALDQNKRGEVHTRYHFDEADDKFIIERVQDIEPILIRNQEMLKADDGYTQDRTLRRVARMPNLIIEKIMKEEGWNPMAAENAELLLQLLDKPEYRKYRTADGHVSHVPERKHFSMAPKSNRAAMRRKLVLVAKPVTGDDV